MTLCLVCGVSHTLCWWSCCDMLCWLCMVECAGYVRLWWFAVFGLVWLCRLTMYSCSWCVSSMCDIFSLICVIWCSLICWQYYAMFDCVLSCWWCRLCLVCVCAWWFSDVVGWLMCDVCYFLCCVCLITYVWFELRSWLMTCRMSCLLCLIALCIMRSVAYAWCGRYVWFDVLYCMRLMWYVVLYVVDCVGVCL